MEVEGEAVVGMELLKGSSLLVEAKPDECKSTNCLQRPTNGKTLTPFRA